VTSVSSGRVCTPVFWAHPVFSHICAMFRNIHCVEVINIYPMSIIIDLIYYVVYYVMRKRSIVQTCSVFSSCKYSYATRVLQQYHSRTCAYIYYIIMLYK